MPFNELLSFLVGDFTLMDIKSLNMENNFDAFISQLTILHIPDKKTLFSKCSIILKSQAFFFIEDFYRFDDEDFAPEEKQILEKDISVPNGEILSKQAYLQLLEESGLVVDYWEDKTCEWTKFVWDRCENFLVQQEEIKQQNGEQFVIELGHFYLQMTRLYRYDDSLKHSNFYEIHPNVLRALGQVPCSRTALGGVRIIGHKNGNKK